MPPLMLPVYVLIDRNNYWCFFFFSSNSEQIPGYTCFAVVGASAKFMALLDVDVFMDSVSVMMCSLPHGANFGTYIYNHTTGVSEG